MTKTTTLFTITRSTNKSSAWLTLRSTEGTFTDAFAHTTLNAARHHVAELVGSERIRFTKLNDNHYHYQHKA
jgi:hypothetical protein